MFVFPLAMRNNELTWAYRDGYRLRVENLHFEIDESDLKVCPCFLSIPELMPTLRLELVREDWPCQQGMAIVGWHRSLHRHRIRRVRRLTLRRRSYP